VQAIGGGTRKTVRGASGFASPDYRSARLTHLELWILFQNKEWIGQAAAAAATSSMALGFQDLLLI
jgi:hypothetical protein